MPRSSLAASIRLSISVSNAVVEIRSASLTGASSALTVWGALSPASGVKASFSAMIYTSP